MIIKIYFVCVKGYGSVFCKIKKFKTYNRNYKFLLCRYKDYPFKKLCRLNLFKKNLLNLGVFYYYILSLTKTTNVGKML